MGLSNVPVVEATYIILFGILSCNGEAAAAVVGVSWCHVVYRCVWAFRGVAF